MSKTKMSTFDREMKSPKFRKAFNESYKSFLFSEFLISMLEKDPKSVRKLAKASQLSPTIIQKLRKNKQVDIKMSNFINLAHACGYKIALEKDDEWIFLNNPPMQKKSNIEIRSSK